jgi:DUF971 family protein
MLPLNLEKADAQTLKITWDDGESTFYPLNFLRRQCPCASCQEARMKTHAPRANPLRILQPHEMIANELDLKEAEVVGRYALNFNWSDGHNEGIYTFDFLRELGEREECRNAKARFAGKDLNHG